MSEIHPLDKDIAVENAAVPAGGRSAGPREGAAEYWHFDALSDDGREAVIIRFHSNYPFSQRSFKRHDPADPAADRDEGRFPAVSFTYTSDGSTSLHSTNEFNGHELSVSPDADRCEIGPSSFRIEAAEYGTGYMTGIDLATSSRRRIRADLEWVSIDNVPTGDGLSAHRSAAGWRLAVPRADVSGRITVTGKRGETLRVVHFRGTGYHDHIRSNDTLDRHAGQRSWGRAHFADSTVIFERFAGREADNSSDLFIVHDGTALKLSAVYESRDVVRDRSGLKIPRSFTLAAGDDVLLSVKPLKPIHSGFFEVQMFSEVELKVKGEKAKNTFGLIEFADPGRMKNPFFRWFSDLRVGKNGKPPLF